LDPLDYLGTHMLLNQRILTWMSFQTTKDTGQAWPIIHVFYNSTSYSIMRGDTSLIVEE
jgi:hypothetical protein